MSCIFILTIFYILTTNYLLSQVCYSRFPQIYNNVEEQKSLIFSKYDSRVEYAYFFSVSTNQELYVLVLSVGGREQYSLKIQNWQSNEIYDMAFSSDGKIAIFGGDRLSGLEIFNRLHYCNFQYKVDIDNSLNPSQIIPISILKSEGRINFMVIQNGDVYFAQVFSTDWYALRRLSAKKIEGKEYDYNHLVFFVEANDPRAFYWAQPILNDGTYNVFRIGNSDYDIEHGFSFSSSRFPASQNNYIAKISVFNFTETFNKNDICLCMNFESHLTTYTKYSHITLLRDYDSNIFGVFQNYDRENYSTHLSTLLITLYSDQNPVEGVLLNQNSQPKFQFQNSIFNGFRTSANIRDIDDLLCPQSKKPLIILPLIPEVQITAIYNQDFYASLITFFYNTNILMVKGIQRSQREFFGLIYFQQNGHLQDGTKTVQTIKILVNDKPGGDQIASNLR
ncbi:UNKNOWN [Stylonychia lemnae]|uniref:Uncharacterized protein n=1 Tax=Stylonychia lemnae TaxID=5949 RepID=A0A078A9L7_STYLE|nr:UNKNOWN [Stylonychia lemnae]|eukprot:CDW78566.1 UNKNOWN [Stylonychia lemnae]